MSLVRVYIARDAMDAHHLRAMLEDQGISAKVIGESLRAAWAQIPATASTLPAVWVDKEDAERALPVVDQFTKTNIEGQPASGTTPWDCPKCGEHLEGQFIACWSCGTPRPAQETA